MIMGVRDNSSHMLYKRELEAFFSTTSAGDGNSPSEDDSTIDRKLIVACSREIQDECCHASKRIEYRRGYVQDCMRDFDLQEWTQGNGTEGLYILICGNKSALGNSAI